MATWTLRTADGERGPLTIYQLQNLVSSGAAGADAEVRADEGPWQRIADVPTLARLLPAPAEAPKPGSTVVINGVALEVGPDGKPVPPTAAQVAQMLAASGDRTEPESYRKARLVLVGVAVALFAVSALLVLLFVVRSGE